MLGGGFDGAWEGGSCLRFRYKVSRRSAVDAGRSHGKRGEGSGWTVLIDG